MSTLEAFQMRCQRQIGLLDVCWWTHVSNGEMLQRSGLSTIGDILRHRRLSLAGHVARLHPRVPAHDALRLTVDIPTKAERQWPDGENHRVAVATYSSTGFRRMPAFYCSYLCCGDLKSPGAMEQCNGSPGLRDDDDDDEGWLVLKMEGKTNFSRHLQLMSGTGIVECLKIIDAWCNVKQFDKEVDRRCNFHFRL